MTPRWEYMVSTDLGAFNALGEAGWELVSVTIASDTGACGYFKRPKSPDLMKLSIEWLGLPRRAENALLRHSIKTLNDLVLCSRDQLLGMQNMGETCVRATEGCLARHGLRLNNTL